MKYFEGLTDESAIKARYKELAKLHHPDLGGNTETMKVINTQYEKVLTGCYQKAGKSITEIDDLLAKDSVLREKLNQIILIEGLNIELCGAWIWITGDTKPHKETLKEAKFLWSRNKNAWYWRGEAKKSYNRNPSSLDMIRYRYGSQDIKAERSERKAIAV